MSTILPTDKNDKTIQAVRLKGSGAHSIAATGTSARNTTSFDPETRIVSIYATEPVYLNFGDENVTASNTDHYFPGGVYYDFAIGGDNVAQHTHVAAITVDALSTVYISEKE